MYPRARISHSMIRHLLHFNTNIFSIFSITSTPSKLHLYRIWSHGQIFCCGKCRRTGFVVGCQWIGLCEDFLISGMARAYHLILTRWQTHRHGIGKFTLWFDERKKCLQVDFRCGVQTVFRRKFLARKTRQKATSETFSYFEWPVRTGKSLSEALILASTNPQYEEYELQVQY